LEAALHIIQDRHSYNDHLLWKRLSM